MTRRNTPITRALGVGIVASLGLCGCASSPPNRTTAPPTSPSAAPTHPAPVRATEPAAQPEPLTERTIDGRVVVSRRALRQLQARGPHWLLERVTVRPRLKRGRFIGWRIVRYAGPGQLDPGDIVVRVNGSTLERPEQFMQAWTALPTRDKLVIELLQRGKPTRLQFDVVDP